jgi:ABC-type sugar transport system substrate-binding protein
MMKALITFAAAVAVFGGISSASAQNTAPTTKSAISPSSINEGYKTSVPSGSEAAERLAALELFARRPFAFNNDGASGA